MKNLMMKRGGLPLLLCALVVNDYAQAQTPVPSPRTPQDGPLEGMAGMDHSKMNQAKAPKAAAAQPVKDQSSIDQSGMDHSKMNQAKPSQAKAAKPAATQAVKNQSSMDQSGMDHSKMNQAKPSRAKAEKPAATQAVKNQSSMDHSGMDHSKMTTPAPAQAAPVPMSQQQPTMPGMNHSQMGHSPPGQPDANRPIVEQPAKGQPSMDHSGMSHSQMAMPQGPHAGSGAKPQEAMTHGAGASMGSMQMGPMQGGKAPADARDPNAYAEGTRHASLPGNAMMDDMPFGRVLIDSAELSQGDGEHGQNLDAEAWYGGDYNKVWLKAQGERTRGRLESLRTEALWDHAFAPFWSTQLGVRHDTGGGASRSWLAGGVRGLAPYWFDVEATVYARSAGEFAARFDARYELLFTQRLILEPQLEGNLYSRADPNRGTGTGLSDVEFGLRLRYEIRRQLAPYVGVTSNRRVGSTADLARARGEDATTLRAVAGIRLWY